MFASALWWRTNYCTGVEETYAQGSIDSSQFSEASIADNLGPIWFAPGIEMFDGHTGESLGVLWVDLYLHPEGQRYPITTFNGFVLPGQPGGSPPQGPMGDPADKQTGIAIGALVSGTVGGFAVFDMGEVVRAEIGDFSSLQFPNP